MEFRDLFLKQKEAIRKRTTQVVGMVKPEHLPWRPEKDALTIGEMIRHLWVSEEGVRRVALDSNFAYYETRIPQGLRAVLGTPVGLREELGNLSRVHQETLDLVSKCTASFFEEERTHEGFGFRRKVYTILLGMNEHEIHHRAQLMTYLRILGTPVPEAINRR
ncbi:MAG: DinB family protein [Acidobacteria bacterium]|nr:DinB family protein [Acidobacteriota bacterium]